MNSNTFTTDPPEPPYHLNDDAKFKWHETWPRLDRNRLDACRGWDALVQFCEAWADIRQADREINERQQISKMNSGTVVPEQGSNQTTRRLREQLWGAMERLDRAAEKLGWSMCAPQSEPWSDYRNGLVALPRELAEQDEKETNRIAPGRPRVWTLRRVWAALQSSCGNMTAAARLLSEIYGVTCTRDTISHLVNKYPQFREAIEDREQMLLNICRDAIVEYALAGDRDSREFLLDMYHPAYRKPAHDLAKKTTG
jgi:phage terminase small subunit